MMKKLWTSGFLTELEVDGVAEFEVDGVAHIDGVDSSANLDAALIAAAPEEPNNGLQ